MTTWDLVIESITPNKGERGEELVRIKFTDYKLISDCYNCLSKLSDDNSQIATRRAWIIRDDGAALKVTYVQ